METLIQTSGQPAYGVFNTTPKHVNWRDFDYRTVLGAQQPAWKRWARFKQFEYFGIVADDLIAGCALANLRFVGAAFVYAFQPSTGQMQSLSIRSPFARGMRLGTSPVEGSSQLHTRTAKIEMDYTPQTKHLRVQTAHLNIDAQFAEDHALCDPMSICTQTARHGWVYARKIAGTPATGVVDSKFGTLRLESQNGFAHHDYSAGFMRRDTCWNWACLTGRDALNRRIGLNVSCGVNETSFSENCVWIDGQRYAVAGCRFDYSRSELDAPWRVTSADGAVDLHFAPLGRHTERVNIPLLRHWIASDFRQDFGRFTGTISVPGQPTVELNGQLGFCEDQFARW